MPAQSEHDLMITALAQGQLECRNALGMVFYVSEEPTVGLPPLARMAPPTRGQPHPRQAPIGVPPRAWLADRTS